MKSVLRDIRTPGILVMNAVSPHLWYVANIGGGTGSQIQLSIQGAIVWAAVDQAAALREVPSS